LITEEQLREEQRQRRRLLQQKRAIIQLLERLDEPEQHASLVEFAVKSLTKLVA